MRKLIFILLFIPIFSFGQSLYYVATDGDDDGSGAIDDPWATWEYAFENVTAGDTVYFRGGTWYPTSSVDYTGNAGNSGTYANPIVFMNYPGETPILDFTNHTSESTFAGLNINSASYFKFKGITVQNAWQNVDGQWIAGINAQSITGKAWFEQVVSRWNGGNGFFIGTIDTIYLTNCDAYDNIDSTSVGAPGGRADGFNLSSGGLATDTFKIYYVDGCRSWYNSDNGFDVGTTKQFQIINCWAWNCGRLDGDGGAYKFSYSNLRDANKRRISNCIAAFNTGGGIIEGNLADADEGPVTQCYNNTIYRCESGFVSSDGSYDCDAGYASTNIYNNIVYNSYETQYGDQFDQAWLFGCSGWPLYVNEASNTFNVVEAFPYWEYNTDFTVTNDDFTSVDSTTINSQLSAARKSDGSLPDITVLKLVEGSDLIDGGTDVGLAYYGSTPDIGAFEWQPSPLVTPHLSVGGKSLSVGNNKILKF